MASPSPKPNPRTQMVHAGAYVNFLRVMYAPSEAKLDFCQTAPGQNQAAQLISSLVTTPLHAKAMVKALAASIERYEEQFGEIQLPELRAVADAKGEGSEEGSESA